MKLGRAPTGKGRDRLGLGEVENRRNAEGFKLPKMEA